MNLKVAVLLLLILLLGLIVGVFIGPMAQSFLAPASHRAIVDKMTITTGTSKLTSAYLSSGTSTWTLSLAENFLHGGTYQYTLWVYSYQGDPEVTVCVWGPGEDGKTYEVELTAFWSGRSYEVKCGTIQKTFTDNTVLEIIVA